MGNKVLSFIKYCYHAVILLAVAYSSASGQISQPVDSSDLLVQPVSFKEVDNGVVKSAPTDASRCLDEFHQLRSELLRSTFILTGLALGPIWWVYSGEIALNFLLGACAGAVYLKLLARNVERLGVSSNRVGKSQIAVFVGLIVVATQWSQLQVLPIFFGFLMYKAAVIVYMLRIVLRPQ